GENGDRYIVALNLAPTTPSWLKSIGAHPMTYGLDLSGGVHFLLEVDMAKALGDRMASEADNIRTMLRDQRLRWVAGTQDRWVEGTRLAIPFYDDATRDQARVAIAKQNPDFDVQQRDVDGHPGVQLMLRQTKMREIQDYAISQNLVSLRNRVNELGVSEPLVQ